jgi:hydrogenase-4 component F
MAVAAVFLARQRDFKRMLAYSSVEHMGILVLGVGIGGAAVFGSLLHVLNNALTKAVLFLSAGNIHRAHRSKRTDDVRGALGALPLSAGLFLVGFVAITGSPPFGPFVSEFTIVAAAFRGGSPWIGAAMLVLLFVVFCGMGWTVLSVVQGRSSRREAEAAPPPGDTAGLAVAEGVGAPASAPRETFATVAPIALALGAVLLLGVYVPPPLEALLRDAARLLGDLP